MLIWFSSFLEFRLYYFPSGADAEVREYLGWSYFKYLVCQLMRDVNRRSVKDPAWREDD